MPEGPGPIVPRPSDDRAMDGEASALPASYLHACRMAERGEYGEARRAFEGLAGSADTPRLRALVANDLGTLAAIAGDYREALRAWRRAASADPHCEPARLNADLLRADGHEMLPDEEAEDAYGGPGALPGVTGGDPPVAAIPGPPRVGLASAPRPKVAILSFLFNWPSTGGGIVHTVELCRFLNEAGYEARVFYADFPAWGLGRVTGTLPIPAEAIAFEGPGWEVPEIRRRFRSAIDAFAPGHVLITDSWNMKPHLAEAMRGYPYFLRFQALECLCPLNNLRLLATGPDDVAQCPRNQLASPEICRRCVRERGHSSGDLHRLERDLAGVGTADYDRALRRALGDAEAVLVLNPLTEAMLGPYAARVRVVPWGMDPARFPGPIDRGPAGRPGGGPTTLFMAAVAEEFIKGAHVLHEACRLLRRSRDDFELVVTSDPPGRIDEFTRSVGWASQEGLPRHYRDADICVVPTIAQEGLSRTSVEAMASGLPVVASRIGGLPSTVADGATGLLFEPGDAEDLARKVATLLDDPALRHRMGLAGRRRFEEEFTWGGVIERYYRPLLDAPARSRPP
ncbi:glycosyltransferase [Singulisphaera sp. PoT]|uniref:glycosyltransferase n=1 Tax=Singulisphaera sp. PoT TaxID=3411797 RepID=UPI003BF49388